MGLDTSHDCWHGPYSSFNRFRKSIGIQIGINLDDYEGYNGNIPFDTLDHDIVPLLNHSDCDGELSVEDSKRIVSGINSILDNFVENGEYDYDLKERLIQFRDGCLDAISKNEVIKFH